MSKFRRGHKVRFIVKENDGVVVAVAHGCERLAVEEIFKKCNHAHLIGLDCRDYVINDTYRAVAKCSPEDAWDEETGKEIARKRLYAKIDSIVARKLSRFAEDMQELADEAKKRAAHYNELLSEFEADPLC